MPLERELRSTFLAQNVLQASVGGGRLITLPLRKLWNQRPNIHLFDTLEDASSTCTVPMQDPSGELFTGSVKWDTIRNLWILLLPQAFLTKHSGSHGSVAAVQVLQDFEGEQLVSERLLVEIVPNNERLVHKRGARKGNAGADGEKAPHERKRQKTVDVPNPARETSLDSSNSHPGAFAAVPEPSELRSSIPKAKTQDRPARFSTLTLPVSPGEGTAPLLPVLGRSKHYINKGAPKAQGRARGLLPLPSSAKLGGSTAQGTTTAFTRKKLPTGKEERLQLVNGNKISQNNRVSVPLSTLQARSEVFASAGHDAGSHGKIIPFTDVQGRQHKAVLRCCRGSSWFLRLPDTFLQAFGVQNHDLVDITASRILGLGSKVLEETLQLQVRKGQGNNLAEDNDEAHSNGGEGSYDNVSHAPVARAAAGAWREASVGSHEAGSPATGHPRNTAAGHGHGAGELLPSSGPPRNGSRWLNAALRRPKTGILKVEPGTGGGGGVQRVTLLSAPLRSGLFLNVRLQADLAGCPHSTLFSHLMGCPRSSRHDIPFQDGDGEDFVAQLRNDGQGHWQIHMPAEYLSKHMLASRQSVALQLVAVQNLDDEGNIAQEHAEFVITTAASRTPRSPDPSSPPGMRPATGANGAPGPQTPAATPTPLRRARSASAMHNAAGERYGAEESDTQETREDKRRRMAAVAMAAARGALPRPLSTGRLAPAGPPAENWRSGRDWRAQGAASVEDDSIMEPPQDSDPEYQPKMRASSPHKDRRVGRERERERERPRSAAPFQRAWRGGLESAGDEDEEDGIKVEAGLAAVPLLAGRGRSTTRKQSAPSRAPVHATYQEHRPTVPQRSSLGPPPWWRRSRVGAPMPSSSERGAAEVLAAVSAEAQRMRQQAGRVPAVLVASPKSGSHGRPAPPARLPPSSIIVKQDRDEPSAVGDSAIDSNMLAMLKPEPKLRNVSALQLLEDLRAGASEEAGEQEPRQGPIECARTSPWGKSHSKAQGAQQGAALKVGPPGPHASQASTSQPDNIQLHHSGKLPTLAGPASQERSLEEGTSRQAMTETPEPGQGQRTASKSPHEGDEDPALPVMPASRQPPSRLGVSATAANQAECIPPAAAVSGGAAQSGGTSAARPMFPLLPDLDGLSSSAAYSMVVAGFQQAAGALIARCLHEMSQQQRWEEAAVLYVGLQDAGSRGDDATVRLLLDNLLSSTAPSG